MMSIMGDRIKKRREALGMKQSDLANALSVTNSTVSMYETGKREPYGDALLKLARLLGVTTDWLLGATDDQREFVLRETAPEYRAAGLEPTLRISLPLELEVKLRREAEEHGMTFNEWLMVRLSQNEA